MNSNLYSSLLKQTTIFQESKSPKNQPVLDLIPLFLFFLPSWEKMVVDNANSSYRVIYTKINF